MKTLKGAEGSLLDMVQCPYCHMHEWSQDILDAQHSRTTGLECETQTRALQHLFDTARTNPEQAHDAYKLCARLHIIHITQYAFATAMLSKLPLPTVFGQDVHHYVGDLRTDGSYGFIDLDTPTLEACACGQTFPGIDPKRGAYPRGVELIHHHIERETQ